MRVEDSIYDLPRPPVWEMDGPSLLAAKLNLFPLYFGLTDRFTQETVHRAGRLAYLGTKHVRCRLSRR
jgi:hypothetical protein